MSELFFLLKSIVFTLVVVIVLQVNVGNSTLEEKTMLWVKASPVVAPLRNVADGGIKMIKIVWNKTVGSISSKFFADIKEKTVPGARTLGINLERSQEYVSEKARKLKEISEAQAKKAAEEFQSTEE